MDCLFCKFVSKELETDIVFENDHVLAFKDIYPQAKIHLLFIPKRHSSNIDEMVAQQEDLNHVFQAMTTYAREHGLDQQGYRIVNNMGAYAGQTVFHTHFHLLAGQPLGNFS